MNEEVAFLTIPRQRSAYRPVQERLQDFCDVAMPRSEQDSCAQARLCSDCFSAFCHWACPVANYIPDFNQHLARGRWQDAYRLLQSHNNFPEFTGRLCPAMCEASCVFVAAGAE